MSRAMMLLSSLLLAASGDATSQQPSAVLSGRETVLVSQPAAVPVYNNVAPPKGVVGVTLWGPVEKLPSPPTSAASKDGVLDIVIDSGSIPGNVAARGGLGTIVLGYSLRVPTHGVQYRVRYDLRVPRADRGLGSIAQVVSYFNLRDRMNGSSLWFGQIIFDSRCSKSGDVMWDQGTNMPIYNVVATNFSCTTFGDWRSVSSAIGPAEIAAATRSLRARYPALRLSSDAADYDLTHANVNPEVAVAAGGRARIDAAIRNWQISQEEAIR